MAGVYVCSCLYSSGMNDVKCVEVVGDSVDGNDGAVG
jgi:hypothetical protein